MRMKFSHAGTGPQFALAKTTTPFLKDPISIDWLSRAAAQPGKALNVALAIQWLAGMSKGQSVKVTQKALEYFHVSKDAYRDALNRLELAGLVVVTRLPGQRADIRILDA